MKERKLEVWLYFILLGVAIYIMYRVFQPYLYAIIVAAIFAVVFDPLHKRVKRSFPKYNALSALISLIVIFLIVLVPLILYGIQLSDEVKNFYDYAFGSMQDGGGITAQLTTAINNIIINLSPIGVHWPVFDVAETQGYIFQMLAWIRDHFGDIFSGLSKFFFNAMIFLFALYYFLKDGEMIRDKLIDVSPFPRNEDEQIVSKLQLAITSVVKGSMLVALVQGILTGMGFFIFGIPSALLWGGVAVIAALVPTVGTSLVIFPGVAYLFFIGSTGPAIGLLIWGIILVGLIDNILGPRLVGRGIKLHPLLVLLSALGGIGFFGAVGFLLGPIALAFLFALFDIYQSFIVRDTGSEASH
ncbi:MAG: AI-2E family transporter [Candidatus Paceibacterota bacterium]|jgi:predicted PurR-regulated permease PerM